MVQTLPTGSITNAKARDLEFSLSLKELWELFLEQDRKCAYTGILLTFARNPRTSDQTASLDRIDSTKGYIKGNVKWVHKDINLMKNYFSHEDFIKKCGKVVSTRRAFIAANKVG